MPIEFPGTTAMKFEEKNALSPTSHPKCGNTLHFDYNKWHAQYNQELPVAQSKNPRVVFPASLFLTPAFSQSLSPAKSTH